MMQNIQFLQTLTVTYSATLSRRIWFQKRMVSVMNDKRCWHWESWSSPYRAVSEWKLSSAGWRDSVNRQLCISELQQRRTENKTVYIYYIHISIYYIYTQKPLYRKKEKPSLQQTLLKTMSNVKVFELEVQVHNFIN